MTDSTPVTAFVTGFGPFATIKVNPSSAIGTRVAQGLSPHVAKVEFTELETSIDAVTAYFDELERTVANCLESQPDSKVLLLHLGVHSRETDGVLRAEVQGFNELYASVPDVRGVVFNHEPICPQDGPIETTHESWFGKTGTTALAELEALLQILDERAHEENAFSPMHASEHNGAEVMKMPAFQAPRWIVSRDAGRYLCNCALYRSLRIQEKHRGKVYAIFVHVVDPTQGQSTEEKDDNGLIKVVMERYNPGVIMQADQVQALAVGLIAMLKRDG